MALTPEQIKAWLKTLKPTQITEEKSPVIMPSTTTPTTNIMPKVTQVQPLSPKQNIMSPSLEVQSGIQPEKDYKALATPEEKSKVIRMLQAGIPEATVRAGFRQAIDRRLTQENNARGQEPKNYVDHNNQPIQPEVPLQGGIRYAPSRTPWILPEPVENFFEKANPIGRLTQFIDENVQKIPTITRKSVAEAFKGTPFEGMEALPTMVANTPWSLLKTASATARGITNPFDTLVWLWKLALTEEWHQAIIDRYGSIEWLKKTMTEDPVGLASDALTLVQWWAWIAWKWAKLAWFTDTASKLSNFSKAAGTAADLWLSTIIPQWLQKVSSLWENQPWLANKALNTVAKWLVSWTQPIQSVKDTYSEIKSIIPKKPLEKIIQKDIMKWFRPWVKQIELAWWQDAYVAKATDAVKTISNLKDQIELTTSDWEKITWKTPETISQLDESIPQAKRKIYEAYSSEAEKAGTVSRIDTTPIVQELLTLRDKMKKMIWWWNTVSYIDNVIKDIQNKWQMWVIDALDNTQQLNSKLQAYYRNPNPNDIWNSVVDALVNSKLKEWIDTTIDSSLLDSKYADIKKQYANLKAIEKDVKNRSTVFARWNNKWFFDITDIFTAWEAINAITTFSPAWVVKSWWMFALKELWKYLNSPDTAVKNIFKEVNKQVWEQIQPSTTLNQKWLPLIPEKKTPITPTWVVQEATPNAPLPTAVPKKTIVEKWRATHDPYKTVTMDTKVVAPKKTVVPKPNNTLVDLQRSTLHTEVTKPLSRAEARTGNFETQFWKIEDIVFDRGREKLVIDWKQYLPSEVKIFERKPVADFDNILKEKVPVKTKEEWYISEIAKQEWQKASMLKQVSDDMVDTAKLSPSELSEYNDLLARAIQWRGENGATALEKLYNKYWKDVYGKTKTIVPVKQKVTQSTIAPKTVNVWIKSKFSNEWAYKDIPVIEKVDNITLYQWWSDWKRQFWTKDKKYAEQFWKVQEKTGSFYKVDNGNRVTDVYVEATAPKKQSVLPKPQEKQAVLEGKKSLVLTPKAKVTTPEVSYTKSPEWKRLADWKPIKEDSNTYRMLDRAEQRKLEAKKAKVEPVSKELQPLYNEAKKFWEFQDIDVMSKNEVFSKFETDNMKQKLLSWVTRSTAEKISMLDTQLRQYGHKWVKNTDFWSMYKLEDIYKNDDFFKKYPSLKDVNVVFVDFHTPSKYWVAVWNDIYINSKLYLKDKNKLRSTIVHEIQHMKQDIRWITRRDSEADTRILWDRYKTDPREIDAKRKQQQYIDSIK